MQAIVIKYLSPTATKQARIKATTEGGSVTVPLDWGLTEDQQHTQAARALCAKLGWTVHGLVFGTLPNGDHVAVLTAPQ